MDSPAPIAVTDGHPPMPVVPPSRVQQRRIDRPSADPRQRGEPARSDRQVSSRWLSPPPARTRPTEAPTSRQDTPTSPRVGPHQSDLPTIQSVVQQHTATRSSQRLYLAHWSQSLKTGLPLFAVDMVVTCGAAAIAASVINLSQGHGIVSSVWHQVPAWLLLQTALMSLHRLYPGAGISAVAELRAIIRSAWVACLCLCGTNIIFGQLPRIEFVIFVAAAILISISLPLARSWARLALARCPWWGMRTLLIGSRSQCARVDDLMRDSRASGFDIVGYVCNQDDYLRYRDSDGRAKGAGFEAAEVATRLSCPVAALTSIEGKQLTSRLIFQFPTLVSIDPELAIAGSANPVGPFDHRIDIPFTRLTSRLMKRTLDLAIVIPGLLLLALPMAMIGIAIKLCSPGPVFYASRRVGQHGQEFNMWKFRSMVPDAGALLKAHLESNPQARAEWDQEQKLQQDPRIIAGIGQLLRSSSLDELPQLWNVLCGEMSLVGPRPVPRDEIVKYQQQYYQYTHMWPGITGLWQVSGRSSTSFDTRVKLVRHYADNWSLWLDAWILIKTPITVITRRGAY